MATKKTSTATKKTTPKKRASAAKKGVKTTKSTKSSATQSSSPRSFRLERSQVDFMKPAFTIETIYWILLSMAVLALGIWIATLQMRINAIYDQIEVNQAQSENIEILLKTQEKLKARSTEPAAQ